MRRKRQDLRGALQAAKEVLDRAKPEGEGEGLEARTGLIVEYVSRKIEGNISREAGLPL